MFRSDRFNLKDVVFLAMGATLCLLLLIMLIRSSRDRALVDELARELNAQRLSIDQLHDQRAANQRDARDNHDEFLSAVASTLDARPRGFGANAFSSACRCVNREGKPQTWQTAPDDELPAVFRTGGTLRLVWGAEPATLMPMVGRDVYAGVAHAEVLEKLVWRDLDAPFDYVPGLAESWTISSDGREIVYQLFPEARWSDGEPVTSADVVFTYNLVMNEQFAAPMERAILRDVVEQCFETAPGKVCFRLTRPHSDPVGATGGRLWILPRHVYEPFTIEQLNTIDDLCVGSGPWRLERWSRGKEIVFRRNETYWGPKPAIERMVVTFAVSDQQELELFLSGAVDVIGPTSEQWLRSQGSAALDGVGRGLSYETPLRGHTWIGFNLRNPMFADLRTRRALAMLIDRTMLIDTLFGGLGRGVTGPFHPLSEQYDHEVEPLPLNVAEARRLLEEAGWMDADHDGVREKTVGADGSREPLAFTFLIPSNEQDRLVQRYVKAQFAKAGIDIALDEAPWSAFQQRVMSGDFEMIMQRSAGDVEIDAFEYWHSSQIGVGRNYVGYDDAAADELIEKARTEPNVEARMALWRQLHRRLHDQQANLFLWTTPRLLFVSDRVRGMKPRALRPHTSEWYLLDSGGEERGGDGGEPGGARAE